MLAENPDLGYRDVQEILVLSSASHLGGNSVENGYGAFNGGGLMFDREGGFGRLSGTAPPNCNRRPVRHEEEADKRWLRKLRASSSFR